MSFLNVLDNLESEGFYFFLQKKNILFLTRKAETQILPKNIDILKSKMKRLSFQPNTVRKYSQTCSNNHLWITATCQQRPVWSHNDQSEAYLPPIFFIQPSAQRLRPKGDLCTQVWLYMLFVS